MWGRKELGGLQHRKENPGQGAAPASPGSGSRCQTSPVGALAAPVSWQAGFFWFVSLAKLCLQIEDKNENIGRGLHMQWDCFLSAQAV